MPPTFVILGPTAVGKTELSLELAVTLAEKFSDSEIVNADSMQLYRGMDIGTAKVSLSDRRGIMHHMLDVLDVTQTATVAEYQRDARAAIEQIHQRGHAAVVVGGSGLFINALLDDMQFPAGDPEVRLRLEKEAEDIGTAAMYERLVTRDPIAAAPVLPTNLRRIIRALEVIEVTGAAPITSMRELPEVVPAIRVGLRRDRSDIDSRISTRVELMWQQGFVSEVEHLLSLGLEQGVTASKALGYQQIVSAIKGECSMEQAKEDTVFGTRRYVRRQESWFKRDSRIHWFDADSVTADDVITLANRIGST